MPLYFPGPHGSRRRCAPPHHEGSAWCHTYCPHPEEPRSGVSKDGPHNSCETRLCILAARFCPSFAFSSPPEIRGRRECRMPKRTRSLACKMVERTARKSCQVRRSFRHSLRDGLRLMARSPRGAGLDSPRHFANVPQSLTSASGGQDHTLSPSAPGSHSSHASQSVHRTPPHVS